jgi:hypothetical protein
MGGLVIPLPPVPEPANVTKIIPAEDWLEKVKDA